VLPLQLRQKEVRSQRGDGSGMRAQQFDCAKGSQLELAVDPSANDSTSFAVLSVVGKRRGE
jgi:hypothetical protein